MKFPIVVEKKKDRHGDKVYTAFCPLFHDARTFSPCDDKHDAIDEVQEIIQDEVDELLDDNKPLPKLPMADELKKKYPDAKVFWVAVETDAEDEEDACEDDDEDNDDADDENDAEDDGPEYDEEMDDLLDEDDDDEE